MSEEAMLSIGETAARSGVKASALRFYEKEGLIRATRSAGGRRHFARSELRRIAFIRAAQTAGLALQEIRTALTSLPDRRTPTKADWERLSRGWRTLLDRRIEAMTRLRDALSSCIGCGCLSLKACALYNPQDGARALGAGPRFLLGDAAADVLGRGGTTRRRAPPRPALNPPARRLYSGP